MHTKIVSYIGLTAGLAITVAIMTFPDYGSWELFTNKRTAIQAIIIKLIGSSSTGVKTTSLLLWGVGLYASWYLRHKTGNFIIKIVSIFHKTV